MKNHASAQSEAKRTESPFTELFSILSLHKTFFIGKQPLNYGSPDLNIINEHLENSIDILLQGIQSVGYLLGSVEQQSTIVMNSLNGIGFFVAAISNLIEALNTLQADTIYALCHESANS